MNKNPIQTKRSGNPIISRSWGMLCKMAGVALMMVVSFRVAAFNVISPDGSGYTSVAASSEFNGSYTAANLFNYDVSSAVVGDPLPDSSEWAVVGGVTNAYVAFDLGATHTATSLFYAQRASGGPPQEMMDIAQIWAGSSPFDPNNPPVTMPDAVVALTNQAGTRIWGEYPFAGGVTGRYFLINYIQTNGAGYAPGGTEMRLGEDASTFPPSITKQPTSKTIYLGSSVRFSVKATGADPLSYQWKQGTTVLTDGVRISGATTSTLKITGLVGGDAGNYSCTVTNINGSQISSNATLTLISAPTGPYPATVLSNAPLAYWRFNESAGAATAPDYAGGFNGTYGGSASVGVAGPRPSAFIGFESTNNAFQTANFDPASTVTVPPLNFTTNAVTLMAWIYPTDTEPGYAGVVFSRQGSQGGGAGITYSADGTQVDYTWNGDRWYVDTGLYPPLNQWSFVALVITSSNAVSYLGTSGSVMASVDTASHVVQPFDGDTSIGCDNPGDTTRVFKGVIDEAAVFDSALGASQIQAIYAAGIGIVPVSITKQPASITDYVGGTARFSVGATGSSLTYQWFKGATPLADGGKVSGATSANLVIANVANTNADNYSCIVSNSLGAVPSASASLTIISTPSDSYDAAILYRKPVAYWQLDENSGSTAVDYWGSLNGTYGAYSGLGYSGPQPPDFPGFESGNLAVQTLLNTPDSAIAIPPLNLNTNTVTIMAWIYPNSAQNAYTTLFFSRAAGTVAGLNYYGDGAKLGYQWNSAHWDFNSGLTIPVGQWSMVAMVITSTNATLYLGVTNQLSSSVDATAEAPEGFAGVGSIGRDNAADSSRVFDGIIDDVAVFNRALTSTDMETLYATATGGTLPPITLEWAVSPGGLTLTWPSPWTLMQAEAITGPWTVATGVTSGVAIPMSAQARFYRLQY